MEMRTYFSCFLFYTFLWTSKLFADCPYKECQCYSVSIVCEDLGLKAIPQLVSSSTSGHTYLILATNSITSVAAGSLPDDLKSLSFANNPIATIDDAAFNGSASTLESLTFTNAVFTKIPTAMMYLNALTSFSISAVNIQDWNEDVMIQIGQTLTILYLDNVGLTTWPTWLQYFSHLTEITVSDSSISSIPDGSLYILADTLSSLTLDSNRFTAIPLALTTLTSLTMLSMQENGIVDTAWLPKESKLLSLTLTNNNISDANQLSSSLQPYADSLRDLDIDFNKLTQIPDFYFLSQIGSLDFSHNGIFDINSGSVPSAVFELNFDYNSLPNIPSVVSTSKSVSSLYIGWNSIKLIRNTDFSPSITAIDLEHNLIMQLTADSFPDNSVIQSIILNYNPISQISTDAFTNLQHLTELYLSGTRLTRLPLALSYLTSLRDFDISKVSDLICTCMEKNLETWVQSFPSGNMRGNCGEISVYNFFTTLSQACPDIIMGK